MLLPKVSVRHGNIHQNNNGLSQAKEWINVGWVRPIGHRVKVNTDRASKGNPGLATAGGLLRDSAGNWLAGFAYNIGVDSSLGAELWAIRSGLELAWSRGYTKLLVESDSRVAIEQVTSTSQPPSVWARTHIQAIRSILQRPWRVRFIHIEKQTSVPTG